MSKATFELHPIPDEDEFSIEVKGLTRVSLVIWRGNPYLLIAEDTTSLGYPLRPLRFCECGRVALR